MSYPGLVLELGPCFVGLALALGDEVLQSQSVVLPQREAHVPQHEQHELHVLLLKGSHQEFEDVEDEDRVNHLEVVQVPDDGDQVVALLALGRVLVELVKLTHDRLQEVSSDLGKRCSPVIPVKV